jgi:hypothetical protein
MSYTIFLITTVNKTYKLSSGDQPSRFRAVVVVVVVVVVIIIIIIIIIIILGIYYDPLSGVSRYLDCHTYETNGVRLCQHYVHLQRKMEPNSGTSCHTKMYENNKDK